MTMPSGSDQGSASSSKTAWLSSRSVPLALALQRFAPKAPGSAARALRLQRPFKRKSVSFSNLSLHPRLLDNVARLGFTEPTPIQASTIPAAIAGIGQEADTLATVS